MSHLIVHPFVLSIITQLKEITSGVHCAQLASLIMYSQTMM